MCLRPSRYATLEWVDWFSHRLLLEPIGNIPPAEAEAQYYAAIDDLDGQHDSNQLASDGSLAAALAPPDQRLLSPNIRRSKGARVGKVQRPVLAGAVRA